MACQFHIFFVFFSKNDFKTKELLKLKELTAGPACERWSQYIVDNASYLIEDFITRGNTPRSRKMIASRHYIFPIITCDQGGL